MKKRISLLMALLMALSLLPATAVAAEPSEPVQQEEISREELTLAETEENAPTVLLTL